MLTVVITEWWRDYGYFCVPFIFCILHIFYHEHIFSLRFENSSKEKETRNVDNTSGSKTDNQEGCHHHCCLIRREKCGQRAD